MYTIPYLIKSNDKVIEIGGNRGVYAYALSKMNVTIEIFEPNPICSNVLSSWASGKEYINVHQIALSDSSGLAELTIPISKSGVVHDASASLENSDFSLSMKKEVNLDILDKYNFKQVSLIKIDVEGHEFSVLENFEFSKYKIDVVVIELLDKKIK